MFTRNYRNLIKSCICSGPQSITYNLPIVLPNGRTYYLNRRLYNSFPERVTDAFSTSISSPGVSIGSGTTPATELDYRLETPITSGVSGSLTVNRQVDNIGNPFVEFILTISNTGASDITVSEIGYTQAVACGSSVEYTTTNIDNVLLERTVLTTPITIPAGDFTAIRYKITTS